VPPGAQELVAVEMEDERQPAPAGVGRRRQPRVDRPSLARQRELVESKPREASLPGGACRGQSAEPPTLDGVDLGGAAVDAGGHRDATASVCQAGSTDPQRRVEQGLGLAVEGHAIRQAAAVPADEDQ
jgi:hypothetical protein